MMDRDSIPVWAPEAWRAGLAIEHESMRIIEEELGPTEFMPYELPVVYRVIHATADFDFAKNLRFHDRAVQSGIEAILAGRPILADVSMVRAGINKHLLKKFGIDIHVPIVSEDCACLAEEKGWTRARSAMHIGAGYEPGIIAIGNAPTALLEVIDLISSGKMSPELVVGVPVGFVKAAESKDSLLGLGSPFITSVGRKGGSPVAIAIVNALLHMAVDKLQE